MQQVVWVFIENGSKTLLSFFIATQKEMHQSKKAPRKNLIQAITVKGHTKASNSDPGIWA